MAGTFIIPPLNPFNFINTNAVTDARYNNPQVPSNDCPQIWQTNDYTKIQIDSDFLPTLKFYDCYGVFKQQFAFSVASSQIQGVSYSVYEALINFATFQPGQYYAEISYTDDNQNVITWQTDYMDIRAEHPQSILFEYTQTANDFGLLFETGLEFSFRIGGYVGDYQPGSNNEIFTDQEYDNENEDSITYDKFTLNIVGVDRLLPDWMYRLINEIFRVQLKQIDGTYYERQSSDSQLELTRQPGNANSIGKLEIIPQNNLNLGVLVSGDTTSTDYQVIAKKVDRLGVSGNANVAGVFTSGVELAWVSIVNRGNSQVPISIGTTQGGADILAPTQLTGTITQTIQIGYLFNAIQTIYINLSQGVDVDLRFFYIDFNAPAVLPTNPPVTLPKHTWFVYDAYKLVNGVSVFDVDQFNTDWDVATGLGRDGTDYVGCALSGTNGLPDLANKFLIGWDRTAYLNNQTGTDTRGTVIGNTDNEVTIQMNELPAQGVHMFTNDINTQETNVASQTSNVARAGNFSDAQGYTMAQGTNTADGIGLTLPLGSGDPMDTTPWAMVGIPYQRIN